MTAQAQRKRQRNVYRPGQCICIHRRTGQTWTRLLTHPKCPRHGDHSGRWKLAP